MTIISWIWRKLGMLRWPILWLFSPKFIIGTNALILNDQGQVWLQQHRFWPQQCWGLPGGLVKSAEPPAVALRREIREETGLDCEIQTVWQVETFFRRGLNLIYAVRLKSGTVKLDEREIMAAGYFALDALPRPLLASHAKLLRKLKADTFGNS